jgi:hypothetical protein
MCRTALQLAVDTFCFAEVQLTAVTLLLLLAATACHHS